MSIALRLRTPAGLLLDSEVERVVAEDLDGWFGIAPGRIDLVAVLAPGLLVFRDAEGEGYVALAGGLLELRAGECRVMCRDAAVSRRLEDLADRVEALILSRRERQAAQQDVVDELVREALRRMAQEARA